MNMITAALHYRNKYNLSVIPCLGKNPLVKWKEYQFKKPTEDEIKAWWEKTPNANIAILVGESVGLTVVDCDSKEAYDWLTENYLPESFTTPIVKTPHGYHVYFQFKKGLSSKRYLKDIDVKTTGGLLVVPPSINNGTIYEWVVSPKQAKFAAFPDLLYSYFIELNNILTNTSRDDIALGDLNVLNVSTMSTLTTMSTFMSEGQRDNDLFHVANCLLKGGCSEENSLKVLEILAQNCEPPFPKEEIKLKLQSAIGRKTSREKNLTQELYEVIVTTFDNKVTTFSAICQQCQQISTREDRKKASVILGRFVNEGLIERVGDRSGYYRRVDKTVEPFDWVNATMDYLPIWLPLGVDEFCGLLPGNVCVLAGSKDAGKTAWLLNIVKENRSRYKFNYINSEMGPAEFRLRASNFTDIAPSQWTNLIVVPRADNFSDVIVGGEGNINIVDYIEISDNFFKVAEQIKKIHDKLKGALVFIAIQKNKGVDLGRGGSFSIEKARLYISLDQGVAKIISAKNFKIESPIGNPAGYQCFYKLVQGAKIIKDRDKGWHRPPEKEK